MRTDSPRIQIKCSGLPVMDYNYVNKETNSKIPVYDDETVIHYKHTK